MKSFLLLLFCLSINPSLFAQDAVPSTLPENIELFTVKTNSSENKIVPFYLRKPTGFDPNQGPYRLLFMCPYLDDDGLRVITGKEANQELIDLADQRHWVIISPTFKQKRSEGHDRQKAYYYPENFSGKAVLDALEEISAKYPCIDTNHLLFQGLSGGAQFCHRFALWAPDHAVAAAINSSSWFDDPPPTCNQTAWLVTIGDSDPSFNNTLEFVGKLSDAGATPMFRSYIGMVHEGDRRVVHLDCLFLSFYDDLTKSQLGKPKDQFETTPPLALQGKDMPFIGDNQMWEYRLNSPGNRKNVPADSLVYLPSKDIAECWGTLAK